MVKLFVGGFPQNMGEFELAKMIAPYGDIETMEIVRDGKTGEGKGFLFIELQTQEAANEVIAGVNGAPIGERQLVVRIFVEQKKYIKPPTGKNTGAERDLPPVETKKKRPRRGNNQT